MSSNGSFYSNGLPISSAETGLGNVNPGAPVANKASSSFYLSGSVYATLMNSDALLAAITAQQAIATADAAAALASQTAAGLSQIAAAAAVVTLGTTALLKGNNLSDVSSVATSKANLALDQVNNTSDANKPVSTAQATADALVASNASTANALKANIASPTFTGTPTTASTPTALDNSLKLATTAYADSAVTTLSGTVTTALALKSPLASPALTGVPTAPTASALSNSTQLATTAYDDAANAALSATLTASIALKAPLASPTLTGVPVAPTATLGTNTTQLATTAFVLANSSALTPINLTNCFLGRLTLVSGQPVMTGDQSGKQNLYYAPLSGGKLIPTYTGGIWSLTPFLASSTDQVGLTLALAGSANWAADSIHDVFAVMDTGVLKLATRLWDAGMLPTEVLITPATTITTGTTTTAWTNPGNAFDGNTSKASAGAIAIISNPSNTGQLNFLGQDWGVGATKVISKVVIYAPTDTPVTGIALNPFTMCVYGSNDNINWHKMSVTRFNDSANGGVFTLPISVTETLPCRYHRVGFDGGAYALRVAQVQFFNKVPPANGRRLTLHDGILVNDASMTSRTGASTTITTAQYEGIYLGTIHIDTATAGQITAHGTYGPSRTYGVWNCYNRRKIKLLAGLYTAADFYTPVTTQLWNACESASSGTTFSLQALCGLSEEWVSSDLTRSVAINTQVNPASYECGIGVDTTLNFSGAEGSCNIDTSGTPGGTAGGFLPKAAVSVPPFAGVRTLTAIERQGNNGTGAQSAYTGPRSTQLTADWMG